MDWQAAIHYAKMVQAAEEVVRAQVCGQSLTIPLRGLPTRYSVLASIFANDLATGEVKFP